MGKEKDISEKMLEDYNDVFADILNNGLFKAPVINPDDLQSTTVKSQLKLDGKMHEQERDTAKHWKNGTITLALIGLENQTNTDAEMPLRVFSYDAADYKNQVNLRDSQRRSGQPTEPFYPVITVVVYFGKTRWTGPRTLAECFPDVPEVLRPFIFDYKIQVIELAFLTPEEVDRFTSDFRYVADYVRQMKTTGTYEPKIEKPLIHVDEMANLMYALSGNHKFVEIVNRLTPEQKEGFRMYDLVESLKENTFGDLTREIEELRNEMDRKLEEKNRELEEICRQVAELRQEKEEQNRENAELRLLVAKLQQQHGIT